MENKTIKIIYIKYLSYVRNLWCFFFGFLSAGYFGMFLLSFFSCCFWCFRNYNKNTTKVINSLDPEQAHRFNEPNVRPNCFQKLAHDKRSCLVKKELNIYYAQ